MTRKGAIYGLYAPLYSECIRYVGQTVQMPYIRYRQHLTSAFIKESVVYNLPCARWIRKVKENGGEVLQKVFVFVSEEELDTLEVAFIEAFQVRGLADLNVSKGGFGGCRGRVVSEETKRKLSEAQKGVSRPHMRGERHPQFGKRGDLSPHFGKHCSEETKRKISESQKGKFVAPWSEERREAQPDYTGVNNPFYGHAHSEETKTKLSVSTRAAKLGVFKLTEEQTRELVDLHFQGWSQQRLAEKFDIHYLTVRNYLRRAVGSSRRVLPEDKVVELLELRSKGWSKHELASRYSIGLLKLESYLERIVDDSVFDLLSDVD